MSLWPGDCSWLLDSTDPERPPNSAGDGNCAFEKNEKVGSDILYTDHGRVGPTMGTYFGTVMGLVHVIEQCK